MNETFDEKLFGFAKHFMDNKRFTRTYSEVQDFMRGKEVKSEQIKSREDISFQLKESFFGEGEKLEDLVLWLNSSLITSFLSLSSPDKYVKAFNISSSTKSIRQYAIHTNQIKHYRRIIFLEEEALNHYPNEFNIEIANSHSNIAKAAKRYAKGNTSNLSQEEQIFYLRKNIDHELLAAQRYEGYKNLQKRAYESFCFGAFSCVDLFWKTKEVELVEKASQLLESANEVIKDPAQRRRKVKYDSLIQAISEIKRFEI